MRTSYKNYLLLVLLATACSEQQPHSTDDALANHALSTLIEHLLRYSPSGIRDREPIRLSSGPEPILITLMTTDDSRWATDCDSGMTDSHTLIDIRPSLAKLDSTLQLQKDNAVIWLTTPDSLWLLRDSARNQELYYGANIFKAVSDRKRRTIVICLNALDWYHYPAACYRLERNRESNYRVVEERRCDGNSFK